MSFRFFFIEKIGDKKRKFEAEKAGVWGRKKFAQPLESSSPSLWPWLAAG
jgi:hypothetical protein